MNIKDKGIYWTVRDDGAKFKCEDCYGRFDASEVLLTQTPTSSFA